MPRGWGRERTAACSIQSPLPIALIAATPALRYTHAGGKRRTSTEGMVASRKSGSRARPIIEPKRAPPRAPATRVAASRDLHAEESPVVAIGASAGGIDALSSFFKACPVDAGIAFVVIMHLHPTQKSALSELLQRCTTMPVTEILARTRIDADHVYVLGPGSDLTISGGFLNLEPMAPAKGLRLTIDRFFSSLAEDRGTESIGVVLSGAGSDGTQGLRAIKEMGGATFVQDPSSAKVAAMPQSAVAANVADIVAPGEQLPERIVAHLKHGAARLVGNEPAPLIDDETLGKILHVLRGQTRQDFTGYKRSTLARRIERRMGVHRYTTAADYLRYLRSSPQEGALLLKELLIGVTKFFRDAEVWEQLKDVVLPAILERYPDGGELRAWLPGCSTGEEAYSLAMIFSEVIESARPGALITLQIFATDIDGDAIAKAREGRFDTGIEAEMSSDRLRRFFAKSRLGYQVDAQIRKMVVFAQHNLVMEPPFTRIDLLSCRNLLIYLSADLQHGLIKLFHHCLKPGGFLLLGSAETVGKSTQLFTRLSEGSRFYRRNDIAMSPSTVEFMGHSLRPDTIARLMAAATSGDAPMTSGGDIQPAAEQMLLRKFAPTALLVSAEGDIVYVNGRTGDYIEPPVGRMNLNVLAMAREGLREPLSSGFRRAVRLKAVVHLPDVRIETPFGIREVDVVITPVEKPEQLRDMYIIVFKDAPAPSTKAAPVRRRPKPLAKRSVASLARELTATREALNAAQEKMAMSNAALQTLNEQLQSANEELQSMNEELQSANEELVTSKEEMQSMNEELQTMNQDLQAKNAELSTASNDMANLLNSTEIATLFLDDALNVRRFTPRAADIIKLIPGDAGRPITDLASTLNYPELTADGREVLRSLIPKETRVSTSDGGWFKVRIMPYRTQENHINGLVITFIDVTPEGARSRRAPNSGSA
jgi:two-component system, chemotaxis family, CheB/CheR fusion protein